MKRALITFGTVLLIGLAGMAAIDATNIWADGDKIAAETTEAQTRIFAIENMSCPACAITVKQAMARVEGVASIDVDFDAKTATVVFDPAHASPQDIAAASTGVGFPARLIEGTDADE